MTKQPTKHAGGRPKTSVKQKLSAVTLNLEKISKLYKAGWTDEQVADFLGVSRQTIETWKKDKELALHLKDWKKEADARVERCLYERATGFEYDEVSFEKIHLGDAQYSKAEIAEIKKKGLWRSKIITKKVVPDVTAQIFWLKNRQPEDWKDRTEVVGKGFGDRARLSFWTMGKRWQKFRKR